MIRRFGEWATGGLGPGLGRLCIAIALGGSRGEGNNLS
jgi:hypothetical protein